MKAIILAAGMGKRLGKYTKGLPKAMLEFNGKPLLQWQLETLRASGINDIVVVKGYRADKIYIEGVKYYENKDYENTNMVESLFAAEEEMDDDLLVCYADILYEMRVVKIILEAEVDIGITVDTEYWDYWKARLENPEEDMESLVIRNGEILALGDPHSTEDRARVRYVGLIKLSERGVEALGKVYRDNKRKYYIRDEPWMRSKSFKQAYMTCLLQAMIYSGYTVKPIKIQRGWLEFDTTSDYDKYKEWLTRGSLSRFFRFEN